MRHALSALSLALLAGACVKTTPLDGLQNPRLTLNAAAATGVTSLGNPPSELLVSLSYDAEQVGDCVTLDGSARGTVNGGQAPAWFAGSGSGKFDALHGNREECVEPSFHVPLGVADADQVTVAFEDGATHLSATFLNLGRVQSISVTPPAGGHIHPGSIIGIDWAPATDDLATADLRFGDQTGGEVIDISQGQGSTISYTIPATWTAPQAEIFAAGRRSPGLAACEGAVGCDVGSLWFPQWATPPAFQAPSVTLTIEP